MHPFELSDSDLKLLKSRVAAKRSLAAGREQQLFSVFEQARSPEERVALEFLYAFMPLVDLADYSGELFLRHVRHSLETKRLVNWGERISGALFLHFVLPYRISNEFIEDYRPYFLEQLYDRVQDLSMADAILETNHWCHEKATYIASDPRCRSPLNLVKNARGRCGEESALLTVALRSLGIPARQVYTPRWAHTDSNHAWVEAWADGHWFHLGACEPEPRLNMGWFSAPATRAMLIHTKVPGTIYRGPEEQVQIGEEQVELNLLARYAPTRRLVVAVRDSQGCPVNGAGVEFQVFNYGGFFSLATLTSGSTGEVELTTGVGDLLIHAHTQTAWGSVLARAEGPGRVELTLGAAPPKNFQFKVPEPGPGLKVVAGPTERLENERRLQQEDHLRTAYEQTFVDKKQAARLAWRLGLEQDRVCSILEQARGNSQELAHFLQEACGEYGALALDLLTVLSAKDLTDVNVETLWDHLHYAGPYRNQWPGDLFRNFILQPRISLETLRPYRKFFLGQFSTTQQAMFRRQPSRLIEWVDQSIKSVPKDAVRGQPSPRGVFELGLGDPLAKECLFVALARCFGIPARLAPLNGEAEYFDGATWAGKSAYASATLTFKKSPDSKIEPEYHSNFSLARLQNQLFQVLRFKGLDEEAFDAQSFERRLAVCPGCYRLTTGRRLRNGNVQVRLNTFSVEAGETKGLEPHFAPQQEIASGLGQLPPLTMPALLGGEMDVNKICQDSGVVLIWLEPEREPTKHLVHDLKERSAEFDAMQAAFLFCLNPERITSAFDAADYRDLPQKSWFVHDRGDQALERVLTASARSAPADFPVVVAADQRGVIRYVSAGYQIGTGGQILASLQKG